MNNSKEIKWEIKEIAPGIKKIGINALGRIPTFEEFKQKAREILLSGHNLCNEAMNADLAEELLLRQEFKEKGLRSVVFICGDNEYTVDKNNIDNLKEIYNETPDTLIDEKENEELEK